MTAISLTDFGKRDYRSTLVSTEINQFLPFSTSHSKYTDNTSIKATPTSRIRVKNSLESRRKGIEEKESSRKIFLDLKKIIFTRTKLAGLWIPALKETTTATGAPPDEYERPDDLKEISINRIVASNAKALQAADLELSFHERLPSGDSVAQGVGKSVGGLLPFADRLKMSVFGQILEGIKHWDDRPLRRSFAHMQDAGQARAFFVKFTGALHYLILSYLILFYLILSYLILSYLILSYLMSCLDLYCPVLFLPFEEFKISLYTCQAVFLSSSATPPYHPSISFFSYLSSYRLALIISHAECNYGLRIEE